MLAYKNEEFNYRIYKSDTVIKHQKEMLVEIDEALLLFKDAFPEKDPTWGYKFYNTFTATAPSFLFYDLFSELKTIIRDYIGHNNPLWVESWINYHLPNQVLDWHSHLWPVHGYISIDPKQTRTVFDGYSITNELGNIYIGPGYRRHKVEVLEHFHTPRITLGFDVVTDPSQSEGILSLIPI